MQKSIKSGFTAKKCIFQGVPGYMVEQLIDGVAVCSQFLATEHYNAFCNAVGVVPVITE